MKNDSIFALLDSDRPATLKEVFAALVQLREVDEATILELVSDGRMEKLFPYDSRSLSVVRDKTHWPFPSMDQLTPAVITAHTPSLAEQEDAIRHALRFRINAHIKKCTGDE